MAERFENLVELCDRSCARYAERPLYGTKRDGAWKWTTYREFHNLIDLCRSGLAALGVKPGDRVAIIADNRVEWAVAAYASYGLGASFVPLYQAQRPEEWRFILADCGATVVFAATDAIFNRVREMAPTLPQALRVIGLDRPADDPASWAALLEAGSSNPTPAIEPDPQSIAGFIYTSGTTGKPKGVLLSHRNIASNITAVHEIFTFEPDDRSLSFLPWAHSYGQTVEVHGLLSMGCSVAINDDLANLLPNLAEVRPTILVAVPRIFHRIYDNVSKQISERPGFLQRFIRTGVKSAVKQRRGEHLGPLERFELAFDDKLIFAKVRERVGGRLKYAISASATLGREVAEFIDAVGLTVYEGYGLTETSPIVAANVPGHRRFGSVGYVVPGVRVFIDTSKGPDGKQGEIVVFGPNVMVGYHNRPEENARALGPDGGLHTGDLGYLDEDNYLYITGRIKEQYKLENGKYVMPGPLEESLKLSPFIANVMLFGDGRPFNVALLAINEAEVRKWAAQEHVALGADLCGDERVRALIRAEIALHGQEFRQFEKVRDFVLIAEDFSQQNGLLTPTLKLRRGDALSRYRPLIEALYVRQRAPGAREAQPGM